ACGLVVAGLVRLAESAGRAHGARAAAGRRQAQADRGCAGTLCEGACLVRHVPASTDCSAKRSLADRTPAVVSAAIRMASFSVGVWTIPQIDNIVTDKNIQKRGTPAVSSVINFPLCDWRTAHFATTTCSLPRLDMNQSTERCMA